MKKLNLYISLFVFLFLWSCSEETNELFATKEQGKASDKSELKAGSFPPCDLEVDDVTHQTFRYRDIYLTYAQTTQREINEYNNKLAQYTIPTIISNCFSYLNTPGYYVYEWSNTYNCYGYALNTIFGVPRKIYSRSELYKVLNSYGKRVYNLYTENQSKSIIAVSTYDHCAVIPRYNLYTGWMSKINDHAPLAKHPPYALGNYTEFWVVK